MNAWLDWIYEIALSRVDTIERELYAHPERSQSSAKRCRSCTRRWTKQRTSTPP